MAGSGWWYITERVPIIIEIGKRNKQEFCVRGPRSDTPLHSQTVNPKTRNEKDSDREENNNNECPTVWDEGLPQSRGASFALEEEECVSLSLPLSLFRYLEEMAFGPLSS